VSDNIDTYAGGADRYIGRADAGEGERLAAQRVGALEELRGALALCHLPERPRTLEIGCGSGVFTQALLEALPQARITATDLNERLLAEAHRALGRAAGPGGRVRLERADAAALPYPARSFDLVACRCVLMHQADPTVVAAEMHRVAEVGGYALVIEPDWGARALYPDAEALAALLYLAQRGHAYGFPDLRMGRKLFGLLRSVGFGPVWLRATSFVETANDLSPSSSPGREEEPGERALTPLPATLRYGEGLGERHGPERLLEQGRQVLRSASLTTDAELDALIARLAAIPRSQDYCSAGVDFAAVGQKPPRNAPPVLP
jgi:SAM-dependent methyltransferase